MPAYLTLTAASRRIRTHTLALHMPEAMTRGDFDESIFCYLLIGNGGLKGNGYGAGRKAA